MEVKFSIAGRNDLEDIIRLTNECFDEQTPWLTPRKFGKSTSMTPTKFISMAI